MQQFIDQLVQEGYFQGMPKEVVYAVAMLLAAFAVLSFFVAPLAGITSWLERRVWARMQSRVGPNRVGPQGILQWLADGIKNLLKEDLIPSAADKALFSLAPYVVFMGFLCTFVAIPFGSQLIVADLNIGILYILAVTSLVVVGILMAGWSSNNKWSLLGGMRSLFFFFAEWGNLYVIGSVSTTLFLGGWQVPAWSIFDNNPVLLGVAQFVVFFLKAYLWVFVAMWVRATLPRVRVDQLMALCWKYMVPLSFFCLLGTLCWMLAFPKGNQIFSVAMFVLGLIILDYFCKRVIFQIRQARPELYFKPHI